MFDALQRHIPLGTDGTNTAIISVTTIALVLSVFFSFALLVLNARKNHLSKLSSEEKDRAIALAQKQAGEANAQAGRANLMAAEANERAGKAHERAGLLEREAAEARERQAELEAKSEGLRLRAEELHAENLSLEIALSDRLFEDQGSAAKALKQFAGVRVRITYLDDVECKATAEQIAVTFHTAGWRVYGFPSLEMMSTGVKVSAGIQGLARPQTPVPLPPAVPQEIMKLMKVWEQMTRVTEVVASVLSKHSIQAATGPPDSLLPVGEIAIRVGVKNQRPLRVKKPESGGALLYGNRMEIPRQ